MNFKKSYVSRGQVLAAKLKIFERRSGLRTGVAQRILSWQESRASNLIFDWSTETGCFFYTRMQLQIRNSQETIASLIQYEF